MDYGKFDFSSFIFRVNVRKGNDDDLTDYVAEVYSDRPIPKTFQYKDPKKHKNLDGIHHSVLSYKFKKLANYVENFGDFKKTLGVKFMDLV